MKNTNFSIVKTFDESDFINEFKAYNRADNFSLQGLRVMFDALNEIAQDCEMVIEMDVIALCCEYTELSIDDVINDYRLDSEEDVSEYLQDNTMVLGSYEIDDTTYFLFQAF